MTSALNEKIKNLELEGLKLRNQVENILNEENHDNYSGNFDSVTETDSSLTERDTKISFSHIYEASANNVNNGCYYTTYQSAADTNNDYCSIKRELEDTKSKLTHVQLKMKQESQKNQIERDKLLQTIEELENVKYRFQGDLDSMRRDFDKRVHQKDSTISELKSQLTQIISLNKKQEKLLTESSHKLSELESSQSCMTSLRQLRNILKKYEGYRSPAGFPIDSLDECSVSGLVSYVDRCLKELSSIVDTKNHLVRDLEGEIDIVKRNASREKEKAVLEYKHNLTYQEEQNNYLKKRQEEQMHQTEREMDKMRKDLLEMERKLEEEMLTANNIIDGLERNMQEMSMKYDQSYETWTEEKRALQNIVDENERMLTSLRAERDLSSTQKSSILAKLDAAQSKLTETENQLLQYQTEKFTHQKQMDMVKKRNSNLESSLTATRVCLESITKTALHSTPNKQSEINDNDEDAYVSEEEQLHMLFDYDEEKLPWKPKKYEVQEVIKHIKLVNKKLLEARQEINELKHQEKSLRKQVESMEQHKRRSEQSIKSKDLEVTGLQGEVEHVNTLLCTRNTEVERLTAERDYYFQMLNEKSEELTNCKTENHRLSMTINPKMALLQRNFDQLEEKCRQLDATPWQPGTTGDNTMVYYGSQQNESHQDSKNNSATMLMVQKEMELIKHKYQSLKQQKEHLETHNRETKMAMREESEATAKKLEMKVDKLEMEKKNLETELKAISKDYDDLQAENRRLQMRLKDCDKEINTLCHEIQSYSSQKTRKHVSLENKLVDLTAELTQTKSELKVSHDRLRALDKVNHPYNNCMPTTILNEINDSNGNTQNSMIAKTMTKEQMKETKQRIVNLEEQMKTMETNYTTLQLENDKLTALLKRVTNQNERLTEELENYAEENKKLRELSKNNEDRKTRAKSFDRYSDDSRNHGRASRQIGRVGSIQSQNNNDNPIKSLRTELEESIKEARKLLSNHHDKYNEKKSTDCNKPDNYDNIEDVAISTYTKSYTSGSTKTTPRNDKCNIGFMRYQNNEHGCNNSNSSGIEGETERGKSEQISEHLPKVANQKSKTKNTDSNSSNSHEAPKSKLPTSIKKADTNNNNESQSLSSSLTEVDSHLIQLNHSSNQRPPLPNPANKNKSNNENESFNQNRSPSPVERLLSPTGLDNAGRSTYHPSSNRESYQLEEKIKRVLSKT